MSVIRNIRITGFRRLIDVTLEMRPLMVLIGANGVGKTSFLDAVSLLSASAQGNLAKTISAMGGLRYIRTLDTDSEVSFSLSMDVPGHEPLSYELSIVPKGHSYAVASETLSQARAGYDKPFIHIISKYDDIKYFGPDDGKLLRPTWEHDPAETFLSQIPKMFRQPEDLRRILASAVQYHVLDVGPRAPIKIPQQMRPAELPGAHGEDLFSLLHNLRESAPERYEAILDALKTAFPGFDALGFPSVAAGSIAMTWKENGFSQPFYMNQLSEGTLRFLWLTSLMQSPGLSTVTMIDEPEVSLHPELLSLLADLMREASRETQMIVATHSDRLVRFLKPKEVVVMDVTEDGHAKATWADSLDLDRWLADYTLDEVWQMGRMGGRS